MPQHKSSEKRMRTSAAARLRNRADRARIRTAEKRVLESSEKTAASDKLNDAFDVLDRMASKGVIHKNTAARQKAKLAKYVGRLTS